MRLVLLAAFACSIACTSSAPTCERAAGQWRDADGRAYHASANPNGYEMYAMFDTSRPPAGDKDIGGTRYAPVVFDLRIEGGAVSGRRAQRITRGSTICQDRRRVTGTCANGRLVLDYGPATTCAELGTMAPAATLELRP